MLYLYCTTVRGASLIFCASTRSTRKLLRFTGPSGLIGFSSSEMVSTFGLFVNGWVWAVGWLFLLLDWGGGRLLVRA